jgi:hypothetical protein
MARWVGGIATRIPGRHHGHADRSGQLAAPETNIGLAGKPPKATSKPYTRH